MTSPDYRTSEAPSEMLDLYDVLPAPTRPAREDDPVTAIIRDYVAGWSARMTKALLGYAGVALPATYYPASGQGFRNRLRRLGNAQSWRDLLHVLVSFVVTTFSFSVAVSWVFTGPGGITYWFWSRYLPDSDTNGLPALLGFPGHSIDVAFRRCGGEARVQHLRQDQLARAGFGQSAGARRAGLAEGPLISNLRELHI